MVHTQTTKPQARQHWRKLLFLFGIICVAASSINCGVGYPPRLWQCQCRQVCLDASGQEITTTRRACGYTRSQAEAYGEHHANKDPALQGCARVETRCTDCRVSKTQVCQRKSRNSGRFFGEFVSTWVCGALDALTSDDYSDDDSDFFEPDDPEDPGPPPGYNTPTTTSSTSNNPDDDGTWGTNPPDPGNGWSDTSDDDPDEWLDDDDDWDDDDDDWDDDDDDW